ncbi:hypothetical protein FOMPIDRAFT_150094 [Fomitopsis schrenkii]|uniref:Uncharacterized protein n=1 Tax=Fomitopsis schrenkii TaxID=2126942 RepID=S8DMI2_FOMSC|nr:hypothetical protein FOMPIDRAFT_150094 [Fomitopsis schrenkii]
MPVIHYLNSLNTPLACIDILGPSLTSSRGVTFCTAVGIAALDLCTELRNSHPSYQDRGTLSVLCSCFGTITIHRRQLPASRTPLTF